LGVVGTGKTCIFWNVAHKLDEGGVIYVNTPNGDTPEEITEDFAQAFAQALHWNPKCRSIDVSYKAVLVDRHPNSPSRPGNILAETGLWFSGQRILDYFGPGQIFLGL
jgi:Cdc6-like AAA superfamily ATPase